MSRLDVFLRNAGLYKRRSEARAACDAGCVSVEGHPARAGRSLRVGELLTLDTERLLLEVEVLELPPRPVARSRRQECYQVRRREVRTQEDVLSFDDEL